MDDTSLTPTVITNVKNVKAPQPPAVGLMGGASVASESGPANKETLLDKAIRRIEALERAVNGRVSE